MQRSARIAATTARHLVGAGYFGEMGLLTGRPAPRRRRRGEVLCHRLDKPGFEAILKRVPRWRSACRRRWPPAAANDATLASLSAEARARATGSRASDLVQKIRAFFGM
jgi:hypothetical protein